MKRLVMGASLLFAVNCFSVCPNGSQFYHDDDKLEGALVALQTKVAEKKVHCRTFEYNYQLSKYEVKEDLGVYDRLEFKIVDYIEQVPDNREGVSISIYGSNVKPIVGHNACLSEYSAANSSTGKPGIAFYDKLPTLGCEYIGE